MRQRRELGHRQEGAIDTRQFQTDDEFAATRPTVLMFHGNGGNYGHLIPLASVFYVAMRCNVLMLSYRGYGHSDGSPSEKGLRLDAQTALDHVLSDPVLSKTSIILYGQSLGGAVAIDLASRNPSIIHALILENTFTSLPALIPTTLPILSPFSFLCHQKWDSARKIPLIPRKTPMLLLSGARDQVVPREHMQALWELVGKRQDSQTEDSSEEGDASNAGKRVAEGRSKYSEFNWGTHNNTCLQEGYWEVVTDFVSTL
jgi:hypothetical protein